MPNPDRTRTLVGLVAFALGLAVIAFTYRDYGVAWDDATPARYGELVLEYFRSGMTDVRCNEYFDLKYYGPLVEAGSAALYRTLGHSPYEYRHLVSALFGLLGVWVTVRYARLFPDPWVARAAGIALALLPAWYGSAYINAKDVPFACFFAWTLFVAARGRTTGDGSWRAVLAVGAALGLALAVRIGGVLLVGYVGAAALFRLLSARQAGGPWPSPRALLPLAGKACVALAVAWLLAVAAWPWAHEDPLRHPLEAFGYASEVAAKPVLYGGKTLPSDGLPWHYLPVMLGLTLPLGVLALAAVGAGVAAVRDLRRWGRPESLLAFLALFWLAFPLAWFVVRGMNVYNGIRHFLFLLPAVAVLAGLGAAFLIDRVPAGKGRVAAIGAVGALLLSPAVDLIRLHPYQATFYNSLAGGVAGAYRNYETDYWVTSYKEAMVWLGQRAAAAPGGRIRVLVAANPYCFPCAAYYERPGVELCAYLATKSTARLPAAYDYYLGMTAYGHARNFSDEPIVHQVGRAGAVFAVIRERKR